MNAVTTTERSETEVLTLQAQPTPALRATHALAATATPSDLLRIAVEQGADLDRLERLMALQVQWEEREAKKAFTTAMSAFKEEPLEIFKRKQVGYTTKEGEFVGYKHAELSDVTDVVGPAMAKHGLSYRWNIKQGEGRITVSCIVTHRLGHSESVAMDAAPDNSGKKNAIQSIASAVTYMQRYTLLAVTGMSTKGMDDDAEGAGDPDAAARRRQWLDDQLSNIAGARTPRELNGTMEYAIRTTREQKDQEAEDELLAAHANKLATAKSTTEGVK